MFVVGLLEWEHADIWSPFPDCQVDRRDERLEVYSEGKWYKAKTIDADGDQVQVHYVNFDDSWDEWVGPRSIRLRTE